MRSHAVTRLGTGLIGGFYTAALHAPRRWDRVGVAYSRREDRARAFAERWGVPRHTTDLRAAIEAPSTDTVVIGRPNDRHEEAVTLAARGWTLHVTAPDRVPKVSPACAGMDVPQRTHRRGRSSARKCVDRFRADAVRRRVAA